MRILVIGCGSIGQRHIKNLVFLKAGEILAFDIDRKKLEEVKDISPLIKVANNLRKLWEENPETVFITVPTALHTEYAIEAAKRGCHLFIEKPLSHNMRRLDELIKIAKNKKLVTFVGYSFRFNNCLVKMKELLENKAIGKIIAGRFHFGSYLPERHPWEDYRFGYGAKKSLGGGVILDVISHNLDSLIFLLGKPKEVFCYSSKKSDLCIDVEDISEVMMKFCGGEIISLHGNFFQRPYEHTFELIGDQGTIFCDFVKKILRSYNIEEKNWVTYHGARDLNTVYIKEVKYFIKCIEKKMLPPVDVARGKEELEILMKIKQATFKQGWLKI